METQQITFRPLQRESEREKGGEGEIKQERKKESKMAFGKLLSEINEKVGLVCVGVNVCCQCVVILKAYQKCDAAINEAIDWVLIITIVGLGVGQVRERVRETFCSCGYGVM